MTYPGYGQPQYGGQPPQINNNIGIAIAGLLLFWPVGLFGLIAATKVNRLVAEGNFPAAQQAADDAKKWGKIGVIVGAIWWGLWILISCLFCVLGGGLALFSDTGSY